MAITQRAYTDNDLPQLQAAIAAWIQEAGDCGYCHIGELTHHIYKGLHGKSPRNELVHIWEDETGIVGIAVNHLFDNTFEVFTSPKYRGTESEIQMLQIAAATTLYNMQKMDNAEKSVNIDVWNCDATRQQVLSQLGFVQYRIWTDFNERSLSTPIPEPILPHGFTIRSCTLDDIENFIVAYNSAFNGKWDAQDYREHVMKQPGYNPKNLFVVVAPDGQFTAFTIIWFDEVNKVGLFEPVGTHQDFHRRGLARALMLHCLHLMKERGMKTAKVGHDSENVAAKKLYHSIGFSKKYHTLGYKK